MYQSINQSQPNVLREEARRTNGGRAQRHAVALKIEKRVRKAAWVASRHDQLGGLSKLRTIRYSHFRERSCSSSATNAPVFEVLAMETLPRDSASPEDCSHVTSFGDCASLKETLPRGPFLRADAVLAVGRSRCEGQEGRIYWEVSVILPLRTHLQARSNNPSAFRVCWVRDRLDSEAGGYELSSCSFTSCESRKKKRGKIIAKLWKIITKSLGKNEKKRRQDFVDLPFFFHSAETVSVYRNL